MCAKTVVTNDIIEQQFIINYRGSRRLRKARILTSLPPNTDNPSDYFESERMNLLSEAKTPIALTNGEGSSFSSSA